MEEHDIINQFEGGVQLKHLNDSGKEKVGSIAVALFNRERKKGNLDFNKHLTPDGVTKLLANFPDKFDLEYNDFNEEGKKQLVIDYLKEHKIRKKDQISIKLDLTQEAEIDIKQQASNIVHASVKNCFDKINKVIDECEKEENAILRDIIYNQFKIGFLENSLEILNYDKPGVNPKKTTLELYAIRNFYLDLPLIQGFLNEHKMTTDGNNFSKPIENLLKSLKLRVAELKEEESRINENKETLDEALPVITKLKNNQGTQLEDSKKPNKKEEIQNIENILCRDEETIKELKESLFGTKEKEGIFKMPTTPLSGLYDIYQAIVDTENSIQKVKALTLSEQKPTVKMLADKMGGHQPQKSDRSSEQNPKPTTKNDKGYKKSFTM